MGTPRGYLKLLSIGVHRGGHAANDLPRTVSANPGVGGAQCFRESVGWLRSCPAHLYPVMIDRDIAGDLNGQLLDRERLQLDPSRHVRRDPVGDLIFSHGR